METKGGTFTITFCDRAENHVGMQQIGELADRGYNQSELEEIQKRAEQDPNVITELYSLDSVLSDLNVETETAQILVIRGALKTDDLKRELESLEWDKKAFMYGRVVNKKARHNLCFADFDQEPNYEQKMGRVISFENLPYMTAVRSYLWELTNDKLVAEGNHYYNDTCGIGYHGDTERRKVIGVRIGKSIPLIFQWYFQREKIGKKIDISLNDGDIYFMSEKTTGFDWKRRTIYTLRHAAGSSKYIN